jgi:hypothetical protein
MPDTPQLVWTTDASLSLDIGGTQVIFEAADIGAEVSSYSAEFDFSGNPHAFSNFMKKLLPEGTPDILTSIDIQKVEMEIGTRSGKGMQSFSMAGSFEVKEQPFDMLFLYRKTDTDKPLFLFFTRYRGTLPFSSFPLVGELFPDDFLLRGLMISYASQSLEANVDAVFDKNDTPYTATTFSKGIGFGTTIKLGSFGDFKLQYNAKKSEVAAGTPAKKTDNPAPIEEEEEEEIQQDKNEQKIEKKTSSGFSFKNVKMLYKDKRIGIEFSGGVQVSAFELSVMGLQVTVPMEVALGKFGRLKEVEYRLDGLALDIRRGPLVLAGSFLRSTHTDSKGDTYDEYAGMVSVGFKNIQLAGIGAYAKYQGSTSLFLFAYLGFPIGGPPAFFVTGLAFGFGINRNFIAPPIEKVAEFPFIQLATPAASKKLLGSQSAQNSLSDLMTSLHTYLPPSLGDYFVVAGINFDSFKIISTQALVAVKFGNDLEVTLLGISRMTFPAVYIELMFMAQFIPSQGLFMARGQLTTNSYLFSSSAKLTGGFAVGFWFSGEYAGDFVVSIGGYHPDFRPPKHYPTNIPRVGLDWRISNEMSIKGEMYFALTPKAIMAGFSLEASYNSGALYAYLRISADFIIYWKPFYYDARITISAAVRVTIGKKWFSISIDVSISAGLHIWGPDFSGEAFLDVGIKTFKVSFGANAPQRANPISWEEFKTSFIPPTPGTIAINGGLIGKIQFTPPGENAILEVSVVNPKDFLLVSDSVIPATRAKYQESDYDFKQIEDVTTQIGIAPMDARSIDTLHEVLMEKLEGANWTNAGKKFKGEGVTKNVPVALWGQGIPNVNFKDNQKSTLGVFSGFSLSPFGEVKSGETQELDKATLAYNLDIVQANLKNMKMEFKKEKKVGNIEDIKRKVKTEKEKSFLKTIDIDLEDEENIFAETEKAFQLYTPPLIVGLK